MGLGEYNSALRARGAIVAICEAVVNRMRPEPLIGTVKVLDYWNQKCEVELPGDEARIQATFPKNLGPVGFDVPVRISGRPGAWRVTEVLGESAHTSELRLRTPRLRGGVFNNAEYAIFEAFDAPFISVSNGNCVYYGKFHNPNTFEDGKGYVELFGRQAFFATSFKKYEFYVGENMTAGAWQILLPVTENGRSIGNDWQAEIMTEGTGFHLRFRRKSESGAAGSAIPIGGMWIWGQGWKRDYATAWNFEMIDTEPTAVYGQGGNPYNEANTGSKSWEGPFYDAGKSIIQRRLIESLTGGGIITWDGTRLGWSQPFQATTGVGDISSAGYINIAQPPNATVIQHHGMPSPFGETSHTATAAGINMQASGATQTVLYYDPPLRGTGAADNSRWHLVGVNAGTKFTIPSHWLMIAAYDGRGNGIPSLRLGVGRELDHWRAPTFSGTWVNYGTVYAPTGYKCENGRVHLRGLVKSGAASSTIFVLPTGYRPEFDAIFSGIVNSLTDTTGAASAGTAHNHPIPLANVPVRVDVRSSGDVAHNNAQAGTGFVSLEGISFTPGA